MYSSHTITFIWWHFTVIYTVAKIYNLNNIQINIHNSFWKENYYCSKVHIVVSWKPATRQMWARPVLTRCDPTCQVTLRSSEMDSQEELYSPLTLISWQTLNTRPIQVPRSGDSAGGRPRTSRQWPCEDKVLRQASRRNLSRADS